MDNELGQPNAGHGNRTRARACPAVVGIADHSGWAILVTAATVNREPTVVDRRRVALIEKGVPEQPYHHETLSLGAVEAERLVRAVRRSIASCTALAFSRLAEDLWPRYRISTVAIREPTLASLPATVAEAHGSYHTRCRADGMLYHSAICAAARRRDWVVAFHRRGEELAMAAEALRATTQDVERLMHNLRRTLGPPWAADHRHALAAAIGRLRVE